MAEMTINKMVEKARKELTGITGLKTESTVATFKGETGWHVIIEMLEKESIPDGMDILATYEVVMNDSGDMLEFTRKRMRKRIDTIQEGEENYYDAN
ncbi:MAG: gas vesicle protein GvpO [Vulcanimicrobiota bacterium]